MGGWRTELKASRQPQAASRQPPAASCQHQPPQPYRFLCLHVSSHRCPPWPLPPWLTHLVSQSKALSSLPTPVLCRLPCSSAPRLCSRLAAAEANRVSPAQGVIRSL